MSSSTEDSDDKFVIDVMDLGAAEQGRATRPTLPRRDDRCADVTTGLGRGTRDHPAQAGAANDPPSPRPHSAGGGSRDPVAVLRMWPASVGSGPPVTAVRRKVDDKVVLAHLALDLYRELGQAEDGHAGHVTPPAAAACTDPACEARISALRGGLVEACLLIQRVVMMSVKTELVAGQLRELLALIDR
jgi:hypothetical protein